jgi:hypothetical protein
MSETMKYVYVFGTFAVCIGVAVLIMWAGENHRNLRWATWLKEFQTRWPDRCPICSYWRYGFYQGFDVGRSPPPHDCCPERGKTDKAQTVPVVKGEP